jgi:hypothetical protein
VIAEILGWEEDSVKKILRRYVETWCGDQAKIEKLKTKSSKPDNKTVAASSAKYWSGRRESNPRMQLGKLPFYH